MVRGISEWCGSGSFGVRGSMQGMLDGVTKTDGMGFGMGRG